MLHYVIMTYRNDQSIDGICRVSAVNGMLASEEAKRITRKELGLRSNIHIHTKVLFFNQDFLLCDRFYNKFMLEMKSH